MKLHLLRRIGRSKAFQKAAGNIAALYLRLVRATNSFRFEPDNVYDLIDADFPIILTFWHGQHFMMPFVRKPHYRAKVLVSNHRDGEINAIAAERLGVGTIRGSGAHGGEFHRKGGVPAFMAMRDALREGISVASTADVPKVSRVPGLGIIMLARESGRPIVPVAIATSRFIRLRNWDRSTIHLPFGKGAAVVGSFIRVPPDASDDEMDALRLRVGEEIERATARAYALVGRPVRDDDRA